MSEKLPYATTTPGVGGQLKRRIMDFVVKERTFDGRLLEQAVFTDSGKKDVEKVWPAMDLEKEHLHLTMEKFNVETIQAVRRVARWLRTSRKRIGYAGLKDKRAITVQRISLWKPDLEKVKSFGSRYIDLRDAAWSDKRIELGDLKGNAFEVTVRDVEGDARDLGQTVKACFAQIAGGIPNYFGEQRFGGARKISHLVGREFVRGSVEEGVMVYLTATYPGEEEDVKEARLALAKSNDFAGASKAFPVKYRYERAIIHHLCRYPNDFVGAFKQLPKSLTYLFTHAYQSHLFNKVVARRLEAGFGLGSVEGDVLEDGIPTAPLYGFESVLAKGKGGEIERAVLEEEGVALEDFKVKQMPELSARGARRKIALHPKVLKLVGVAEDEFYPGKKKVTVSFELEKGCYATTVLRELMKVD